MLLNCSWLTPISFLIRWSCSSLPYSSFLMQNLQIQLMYQYMYLRYSYLEPIIRIQSTGIYRPQLMYQYMNLEYRYREHSSCTSKCTQSLFRTQLVYQYMYLEYSYFEPNSCISICTQSTVIQNPTHVPVYAPRVHIFRTQLMYQYINLE